MSNVEIGWEQPLAANWQNGLSLRQVKHAILDRVECMPLLDQNRRVSFPEKLTIRRGQSKVDPGCAFCFGLFCGHEIGLTGR